MTVSQPDNRSTNNGSTNQPEGDVAPEPMPFTLVGSEDAGYCVDGVCVIPTASAGTEEP